MVRYTELGACETWVKDTEMDYYLGNWTPRGPPEDRGSWNLWILKEYANMVIDEELGRAMEYRDLLKHPKHKELLAQRAPKLRELVRLASAPAA